MALIWPVYLLSWAHTFYLEFYLPDIVSSHQFYLLFPHCPCPSFFCHFSHSLPLWLSLSLSLQIEANMPRESFQLINCRPLARTCQSHKNVVAKTVKGSLMRGHWACTTVLLDIEFLSWWALCELSKPLETFPHSIGYNPTQVCRCHRWPPSCSAPRGAEQICAGLWEGGWLTQPIQCLRWGFPWQGGDGGHCAVSVCKHLPGCGLSPPSSDNTANQGTHSSYLLWQQTEHGQQKQLKLPEVKATTCQWPKRLLTTRLTAWRRTTWGLRDQAVKCTAR